MAPSAVIFRPVTASYRRFLRQVHPLQDRRKTWIRPKRLEARVEFDLEQVLGPFDVGPLQGGQSSAVVAEAHIDDGEVVRRRISRRRELSQKL